MRAGKLLTSCLLLLAMGCKSKADPEPVYTVTAVEFDSAAMRPEAKEAPEKIGACALDGPAKGKALRVVGRTDPRGPEEYNKELGLDRARAVAESLEAPGVSETRLETLSRGEAAVDPVEPGGWPNDRRVTVRLDG